MHDIEWMFLSNLIVIIASTSRHKVAHVIACKHFCIISQILFHLNTIAKLFVHGIAWTFLRNFTDTNTSKNTILMLLVHVIAWTFLHKFIDTVIFIICIVSLQYYS